MSKNCFLLTTNSNDDYFTKGLLITLKSLEITNPGTTIVIFYDQLMENQKAILKKYVTFQIDTAAFDTTHNQAGLPTSVYLRFFFTRLREFEKILYIDTDAVVLDSLDELFSKKGNLIARGRNFGLSHEFKDVEMMKRDEKIKEGDPVINGGVLCFDRVFWERENLLFKTFQLAEQYGWDNFLHNDQSILNLLAYRYGGFTNISEHYNFCKYFDMENNPVDIRKNSLKLKAPFIKGEFVKVVHWNGPEKPWNFREIAEKKKYYFECYEQFL